MKIFFSVGEPSGDIHGANLIRDLKELDSTIEFVGLGGPKMEAAGCRLNKELVSLAVMGIIRVVKHLAGFWKLLGEVDEYFQNNQVDAVVLIDFPGFNWWVAKRAKKNGIPVFYYGVPQMWGWAPWRVHKLRKRVDFSLCKLPFEEPWFRERGCLAKFVGHPFFDEVERQQVDREFIGSHQAEQPLVLLLPGSRDQEVQTHAKILLRAAAEIHARNQNVRFACACVKAAHVEHVKSELATLQANTDQADLTIDVHLERTPELIRLAHSCLACSGSVSLELMANQKPTIIVYQIGRVSWFLQSLLRRSKYITLVNLLATEKIEREQWATYDPCRANSEPVPFPEFLCVKDPSKQMAGFVLRWLEDKSEYNKTKAWLKSLCDDFGGTGASANAARFIFEKTLARNRGRFTN